MVNKAHSVEEEAGERRKEDLIDISEDVQYDNGHSQKMAQMLMDS